MINVKTMLSHWYGSSRSNYDDMFQRVAHEPDFTAKHPAALCTYGLGPGGAERQWVYFAKMLARRGIPCIFVTYEPLVGPRAHYLSMLHECGISVLDASTIRPAADCIMLREL